ncbi:hypothetical protein IEQ34_001268 [Dendrobium chrysotoxum]|uniref:Uncharacterized protein n=1 Tax=Dendrobium chrysotoxum TaxID=161865 RepID=A0AAV7H6D5_DENCH|nr:hypothetical protein IEQ34_001268 [Dendrobium chrysotoxum]
MEEFGSSLATDHRRNSCRSPPEFLPTTAGVPAGHRRGSYRSSPEFLPTTAGFLPIVVGVPTDHRRSSYRSLPEFLPITAGVPADHLRSSCRPPPEFLPDRRRSFFPTVAGVFSLNVTTNPHRPLPEFFPPSRDFCPIL